MIKEFKRYINKLFIFYPNNSEVKEFKEELLDTLMAKYEDYISDGVPKDKAFKLCVDSIEDYRETMDALAAEKSAVISKSQIKLIIFSALTYLVGVTLLYFIVSFLFGWSWTWLTFIAGAMLAIGIALGMYWRVARRNSRFLLVRAINLILIMLVSTVVYLTVSFLTGYWHITWVTYLIATTVAYIADVIYRIYYHVRTYKEFDFAIVTLLIALAAYFSVSFLLTAWSWSWLIFLGWVFVTMLATLITRVISYKMNKKDE